MKSSEADVISQTPKPKFVAASVEDKETREVSQTQRASTDEPKNRVAMHEDCPISIGKVPEQIRNLYETSVQIGQKKRQ